MQVRSEWPAACLLRKHLNDSIVRVHLSTLGLKLLRAQHEKMHTDDPSHVYSLVGAPRVTGAPYLGDLPRHELLQMVSDGGAAEREVHHGWLVKTYAEWKAFPARVSTPDEVSRATN
jgi:hypothetical protein